MILERLEATPAWRDGAMRAIESVRPQLEAMGEPSTPGPAPLRLRLAELLRAAGAHDAVQRLLQGLAPDALDPARRARLAFLRMRYLVVLPGAAPTPLDDPRPIGRVRDATLHAESAWIRRRLPRAEASWREVMRTALEGIEADELIYDAGCGLARHFVVAGRAGEAVAALARADEVAARYDAHHDRAALSLWWYTALQQQGDVAGLHRLGERCATLPGGVPGALPGALVQQLRASAEAGRGDPVAATQIFTAGMRAAVERRDPEGYAALALAQARLFLNVSRSYGAYRTLKIAGSRLRKMDAELHAGLVRQALDRLQGQLGDDAFASFAARLREEVDQRRNRPPT